MTRRWTPLVAVALVWLALTSLCAGPAMAQQRERPPVSWVNPVLPPGPRLSHHVLHSAALGHEVGYVVYLPASYESRSDRRYPVIYFLHGIGGNEGMDAAGFSHHVARAAEAGAMPECLVVFPNGGRSGYRDGVEQMIVEELIPLIDAEYRTLPTSRAMVGFSMGGSGAIRLALTYPHLFRAAASWAGGMGRGNGKDVLMTAERHAEALLASGVAFLFINGDRDRPDAFAPLADLLAAKTIPHRREVLFDTGHNLGRYYKESGELTMAFLGASLPEPAEN